VDTWNGKVKKFDFWLTELIYLRNLKFSSGISDNSDYVGRDAVCVCVCVCVDLDVSKDHGVFVFKVRVNP
jgi:hypothetical protein